MDTFAKYPRLILSPLLLLIGLIFVSCDDDNDEDEEELHTITETIEQNEDFETLNQTLSDAGLTGILSGDGPFTFFAPTEEAFADLPEETLDTLTNEQLSQIMAYHIIQGSIPSEDLEDQQNPQSIEGGELYIEADGEIVVNDNATVVEADIEATNGIIHAIDRIVFPDNYLDVTGIVAKRYELEELEEAIEDADLVETLQEDTGDGYTVFAPANDAIEAADLPNDREDLENILTYHVIPSRILSNDLEESQTVTTVNGEEVTIEVDNGDITINGSAMITITDLEGTNGVVHIINEVLTPPGQQSP